MLLSALSHPMAPTILIYYIQMAKITPFTPLETPKFDSINFIYIIIHILLQSTVSIALIEMKQRHCPTHLSHLLDHPQY